MKSCHHPELLLVPGSPAIRRVPRADRGLGDDLLSGNSASTWVDPPEPLASAVASFDDRSTRDYRGPEFSRKLQMIENVVDDPPGHLRDPSGQGPPLDHPPSCGGRKPASHIPCRKIQRSPKMSAKKSRPLEDQGTVDLYPDPEGDNAAMHELVQAHLDYAVTVATRLAAGSFPSGRDPQCRGRGLYDAIRTWNARKGRFTTH